MRTTVLTHCMLFSALLMGISRADTNTTLNYTNKWAWGESTGFINCRTDITNGARVGQSYCSGYFYSISTGWIHLGDGAPSNGVSYNNTSTNDYGVNHDGQGNLRGNAWSDSIGWLYFESTGGPAIDLQSGILTGSIWSESSGWISLSNDETYVQTDWMAEGTNADNDGIPDWWEIDRTGGTGTLWAGHDEDGDGINDEDEYGADTDPTNANEFLQLTSLSLSGTNIHVAWDSTETRMYILEENEDLLNTNGWTNCYAGDLVPDTGSSTVKIAPGGNSATQKFFRVKAKIPLSD